MGGFDYPENIVRSVIVAAMLLYLSFVGGSNAQLQTFDYLFYMRTKNIRHRLLNWKPKYGMTRYIISPLEHVKNGFFFEMDISCGQGSKLKFTSINVHLSLKTFNSRRRHHTKIGHKLLSSLRTPTTTWRDVLRAWWLIMANYKKSKYARPWTTLQTLTGKRV